MEYEKYLHEKSNISLIRVVLIILVVYIHSSAYYTGNWFNVIECDKTSDIIIVSHRIISTFHMPLFVLIAGKVYSLHCDSNIGYISFIRKRIKRLVIPYIMVSLLWCIPIDKLVFNLNKNDIIEKYFWGKSPSQLWFLLMLFGVGVIGLVFKKIDVLGYIIAMIACANINVLLVCKGINHYQVARVFEFFPFYCLGIVLDCARIKKKYIQYFIVILLLLYCTSYFLYYNVLPSFLSNELYTEKVIWTLSKCVVSSLASVLLYLIFFSIGEIVFNQSSIFEKAISYCGKKVFIVYLLHQQIIYFVLLFANKAGLIKSLI